MSQENSQAPVGPVGGGTSGARAGKGADPIEVGASTQAYLEKQLLKLEDSAQQMNVAQVQLNQARAKFFSEAESIRDFCTGVVADKSNTDPHFAGKAADGSVVVVDQFTGCAAPYNMNPLLFGKVDEPVN